jgi:predicted DNA-binding ribbon-helix-helix protein
MDGPPEELMRRSFRLSGHATSVSMERAFWQALERFAAADGRSMASIIEEIDRERTAALSRCVRIYILQRTQAEIPPA